MYWIWTLIVGAIIGIIAGAITSKGKSMGWISNIIAGLIGSAVGQALFGSWGPQLAGMALILRLSELSSSSQSCPSSSANQIADALQVI
jgi:uncharacterized membrane protein YeaQ/YmgE (transglycosylase-associated protein family)